MPDTAQATSIPLSYKAFTAFVTVACVVLCVLLLLARAANHRLQGSFSEAMEMVGSAGLAVGEHVESLAVAASRGAASGIDAKNLLQFEDGRLGTVLLLVSGGCDLCRLSLPYFTRITDLAEKQRLVACAVQLDAAAETDLKFDGSDGFPIVAAEHSERTWLRRAPIVPAIIVLESRGGVVKAYFGELSPKQQGELESFIQGFAASKENAP